MDIRRLIFWVSAAVVIYAYALYPLLVAALGRLVSRPGAAGKGPASFSIIVTAFNERTTILRRVRELLQLIANSEQRGELIVVSDGSTDGTVAVLEEARSPELRVIDLPQNVGKAAALNQAAAAATGQVMVFADVRQSWASDALQWLLQGFSDSAVGAVSGELILESAPGVMAGVGLYWRYEKWLRRREGHLHSCVGVTGAISAVRRELFQPIPQGTVLDDVYWPLVVAMHGSRVIHEERARAYDRLPDRARDELRRKVRTLCGNFQLVAMLPSLLVPWRNPIWFQFVSHKISRLLVPWALILMLVSSALLPGVFYRVALWAQVAFYVLALAGSRRWIASRLSVASAASSFVVLNTAAWLAFWVWVSGGSRKSWHKVLYRPQAGA